MNEAHSMVALDDLRQQDLALLAKVLERVVEGVAVVFWLESASAALKIRTRCPILLCFLPGICGFFLKKAASQACRRFNLIFACFEILGSNRSMAYGFLGLADYT